MLRSILMERQSSLFVRTLCEQNLVNELLPELGGVHRSLETLDPDAAQTPLGAAVRLGMVPLVRQLLVAGADYMMPMDETETDTPLAYTCQKIKESNGDHPWEYMLSTLSNFKAQLVFCLPALKGGKSKEVYLQFLADAFYQRDHEYIRKTLVKYKVTNEPLEALGYIHKLAYENYHDKSPLMVAARMHNLELIDTVMGMDDFDINAPVDRAGTHIVEKLVLDMQRSWGSDHFATLDMKILPHPRIKDCAKSVLCLHDDRLVKHLKKDPELLHYYIHTLGGANVDLIEGLLTEGEILPWHLCLQLHEFLSKAEHIRHSLTRVVSYHKFCDMQTFAELLRWRRRADNLIILSYSSRFHTVLTMLQKIFNDDIATYITDLAVQCPSGLEALQLTWQFVSEARTIYFNMPPEKQ